jgi:DNA polymerase III epsilon subunit-like protein
MIPKAPAPHNVRSAIVAKLHAAICALNGKLEKNAKGPERHLVLSPNELITMALDEEEKVAKENASIYSNIVKLRIVKLSKMNLEDWTTEVKAHLNSRYYKIEPGEQPQGPKPFTTGLSAKEEIAISSKLVTPLEGLEPFGYVTRPPTGEETEQARKGALESKGWEKCDRCGGRFQVFPGRREDGLLTTGGQCTHHPGKPLYPPRKRTDHITGPRDAYYSCCNEALGTSSGCTRGETHVFKVSEAKRLASILQFEKTPDQPGKGPQRPVCFDCEMGYTTQGLELVRLTAVTWPEGKELLDILVRPFGEILDLNSRFSGIFPEHYVSAIPYGSEAPDTASSAPEMETAPMQVVDSPAAARELLFQHLQPDTPLIGHAIDNDLNACRIIHPTVIDTVLLYPHQAGLPIRTSLKMLARRHLDRDIQTGGNRGHDSKEDSVATGDLVRAKVLETWKRLKGRGWSIQDGKLIAPPGGENTDRALGPGAGQKRKGSGEAG